MSCDCYKIGGRFVGADPDCPAHGADGYGHRIAELESELAVLKELHRWRKWPEERPEADKHYQTIGKDGSMGHDYFQTGAWWYYGKKIPDGDVTHWRPIDLPDDG